MDTTGGGLAADSTAVAAARKRPYEREEGKEEDRSMDKMYKCNHWEDPAYARALQRSGLDLAREAAFDNLFERADRLHHAFLAARQQRTPAGYDAAAAIADAYWRLVSQE